MTTPFTITGSLNLPGDAGLPAEAIPVSATGSFLSEEKSVLNLTGAGTRAVDAGTLPANGAKAVLIKVAAGTGVSPILLRINGSVTGKVEIAAGGVFLVSNPAPAAGITSIDIEHLTACTVRVWVLG